MASAYIVPRHSRGGSRWHVRYRLGGRGSQIHHGGAYDRLADAELRRDEIRRLIAGAERPRLDLERGGFVYVIQSGETGPCKVGFAIDVEARRAELQTGNPERLHVRAAVEGTRRVEREIHRAFAPHRIRGEWFALAAEHIEEIQNWEVNP